MTYTSFKDKASFLDDIQEANIKLKNFLSIIKIAMSEQGFPIKKDTYHFLTKVLQPATRVERTLYLLLLQSAYQSELMSAGSAYLSVRFAIEFIEELLKMPDLLAKNEVDLVNSFEEVTATYNQKICSASKPITEKILQEEMANICDDKVLSDAIWEALLVSGLEGKIHVEDGTLSTYTVEQKSGYSFHVLKPFKFMIPQNGVWEASNVKVMLVDGILERVSELDKILVGAMESKLPVLLIAQGFSEEIISTIKVNVDYNKFNVMPIRLTVDLESLNVINDLAVVCGADVISTLKGQMVCFTEFSSLPTVEKVRLSLKELSIENTKTRRSVGNHLQMLLEKRQAQHAIQDISALADKRIQGLISSAVTLKLPNMTPTKKENAKVKIDISLRNAKTLLNHGSTQLDKLLLEPSSKPFEQAFWRAFEAMAKEIKTSPTLSAYVGVYFVGKTILSMMTTNGLVEVIC